MANRNINDIYNIILYIVRKERGSFVTTSEMCSMLDMGQMELVTESFAQYQINQKIVDALSPFKVKNQFTSANDGQVTMPADYLHLLGGVYTVYGSTVNTVRFVNDDELATALTSQLRPVSLSRPLAIDSALGFQLFPNQAQTGFYTYLRRPATPVWGGTLVNRVLTYDPNQSTQIEFYDVYINNIISRALKYIGINLDEMAISQFAQIQQQQTN
jgi:hypothetical protein